MSLWPLPWRRTRPGEEKRGLLWFRDALSGRVLSFSVGQHVFVAGQTGSGKSWLLDALISHLVYGPVADGLASVRGVDLKDGVQFERWRGRMESLATSLEETVALLEEVDGERERRNLWLRAKGLEKVAEGMGLPFVFVFVDEAAELSGGIGKEERQLQERAMRLLSRLLRLGRSAGVTVVAATQDPRKDAFPLRDMFPNRIGLSLADSSESVMLMGEDAVEAGCAPHAIPLSRPGTGYWYDREHRQAVRFRVDA